jgi:hypothetical protein
VRRIRESDPPEYEMRSPYAFAASFKCPVRLYFGADEPFFRNTTRQMAKFAKARGLDVTAIDVPGDHMEALPDEILRSVAFFKKSWLRLMAWKAAESGKLVDLLPAPPKYLPPCFEVSAGSTFECDGASDADFKHQLPEIQRPRDRGGADRPGSAGGGAGGAPRDRRIGPAAGAQERARAADRSAAIGSSPSRSESNNRTRRGNLRSR